MLTRRKFLSAAAAGAATLSDVRAAARAGRRRIRPHHRGRPRHRSVAHVRRGGRCGDRGRKDRRRQARPCPGQRGRNDRRARQAGCAWPDRHPHACRPRHGRSGDVPVAGRHVAHRRRIAGRGSHRRSRRCRESRAQSDARPDQHGEDRHPGRRRVEDISHVDVAATGPPSSAIATSSSASRRGCPRTSPARTTSRRCGARSRWRSR